MFCACHRYFRFQSRTENMRTLFCRHATSPTTAVSLSTCNALLPAKNAGCPLFFSLYTQSALSPHIKYSAGALGVRNSNFRAQGSGNPGPGTSKGTESKSPSVFENILTIPNLLSVTRIAMTPYIGYLIIHQQWHAAAIYGMIAVATDLADGAIARRFPSQRSMAGSFLDPLADKLLVGTLFVALTYAGAIPLPLAALVIGRDIILIASAFVIRFKSIPKPVTLAKYFDLTYATAQLQPTQISKYNTAVQFALVIATIAAPIFYFEDHAALHALWYFTALSTVASGLSYVIKRDATFSYSLLKKKQRLQQQQQPKPPPSTSSAPPISSSNKTTK